MRFREEEKLLLHEHRRGLEGAEFSRRRSQAADALAIKLFADAFGAAGNSPRCALVALGGYGRGELSPQSDLDLLILHSGRDHRRVAEIANKFFYPLWDARLHVGHSVRTVGEVRRSAGEDLSFLTAALDARLLAGDGALFDRMRSGVARQTRARGGRPFIAALMRARQERHRRYGDCACLLQPNIKNSCGGLRDLSEMAWVERSVLQDAGGGSGIEGPHSNRYLRLDSLCSDGYLTHEDVACLAEAREFLTRVRNELHYTCGRPRDELTFEHQVNVARFMGYGDDGGLPAVERFMRDYYLHASNIEFISRLFWQRVQSDLLDRRKSLPASPAFTDDSHKGPARDALGLFAEAIRRGTDVSPEAMSAVKGFVEGKREAPEWSERMRRDLVSILDAGERSFWALEMMMHVGLLLWLVPQLSEVRRLAQYGAYHKYTVDRHCFNTVAELGSSESGDCSGGRTFDVLRQEVKGDDRAALLLAGLLHDVGKGAGKGHVKRGAHIAGEIVRGMGFSAEVEKAVAFLVRNHVLLSETANRRDIDDENLIVSMAAQIQDSKRLKMLYLLTVADGVATGPEAWTAWKATLLTDLFFKVLHVLEHGAVDAGDLASHFESVAELTKGSHNGEVRISVSEGADGVHEFTLVATDTAGLFSKIAGVLSLNGMNILSARAFTGSDGSVVDVFKVTNYFAGDIDRRSWERVESDIKKALVGKISLDYRLEEKLRHYRGAGRPRCDSPAEVVVDNETSDLYTIIEVHAEDRMGLLYSITKAMFDLSLDIHLAKASTGAGGVIDVFYVRDAVGEKLLDGEQLRDVEKAIVLSLQQRVWPDRAV